MNVTVHLTPKHGPASREPIKPLYLVLHDTAGSHPGDLRWLLNPTAPVSCHYLIAPDGDVHQMVQDYQRGWHAGRSSWHGLVGMNDWSIGIEISHIPGRPYPPEQLHALDELIVYLHRKHNFRGERPIGHREIAPGRKSDPQLDLSRYTWEQVEARLGQMEEDDMNAEQDKRLRAVEEAVIGLARSARASSFRESISIAVALGDYATADQLNAEARAAGFVTGYRRP